MTAKNGSQLLHLWRGSIRNRIEWHLFFRSCFIRPEDLVELSQAQYLWDHHFLEFEKFTAVQGFTAQCLKNSFSVFLGHIVSDFSVHKCKLSPSDT